jgi:fructose-1,6-bisphosphatase I
VLFENITKITMKQTLEQFIIERREELSYTEGALSSVLCNIATAATMISEVLSQAGLLDILGDASTINVHGERQKKLDIYANEQFISALKDGGECCAIVSEENEEYIYIDDNSSKTAQYIVAIDPLDGSSNVDVNVGIGTIFSIYMRKSNEGKPTLEDILQKGEKQVAAGYVLYGSSTMLVFTTGKGVNGFILDWTSRKFCLSHPNICIPKKGAIYSINEGNYTYFSEGIKKYLGYCQMQDRETNRPYIARYTGSMVLDFHRNLIKGGIFIYPAPGKLRLVYECNPMAFIIEQAGGRATDGSNRILNIDIRELHQRSVVFMGSELMVIKAEEFLEFLQ